MGVNEDHRGPKAAAPDPLSAGAARSRRRRLGLIGLVALGGAAGTCVRAVIEAAVDAEPPAWPWATFGINVSGALVLGFLLELLLRRGPDSGWRRGVRLAVGTGFLGGYTTYSTFAVEVVSLSGPTPHLAGLGYAAASVVLGSAAAAVGSFLGHRAASPASRRAT